MFNWLGISLFMKAESQLATDSIEDEYGQAVDHFNKALRLDPDNPGFKENLQMVMQALGQGEGVALKRLTEANTIDGRRAAEVEMQLYDFYSDTTADTLPAKSLFHRAIVLICFSAILICTFTPISFRTCASALQAARKRRWARSCQCW
jgi:hypothetical protein